MSCLRARILPLTLLVAASLAAGCQGDTTDLFATGSGGNGSGGATSSSSSKSATSTSVTTTTSVTTSVTSSATTTSTGAICGNGMAELGEACDGFDLNGTTCTDLGFPGGELACSNCAFDTSGCGGNPTCNGVLEPGEMCDGANLNGADCTDFGFGNPAGLKCVNCQFDPSNCKAVCGNNVQEVGEACDDGNMMSGDGCSAMCTVEMPTGNGSSCANPIVVSMGLGGQSTAGTTAGGGAHDPNTNGCQSPGPDRVYAITPTASGFLTATLPRAQATFDSVLYVSQQCGGAQIQPLNCNDSYNGATGQALNGGEVVSLRVQAGTTYYLFVDTFNPNGGGNYTLVLDLSTGTCADPVPIALESGVGQTIIGSNTNLLPLAQGSCGGGPGGEVTYAISPLFSGDITVDTNNATTYNAALYARTSCEMPNSEVACSNVGGNGQESITFNANMGSTVFVKVDGSQTGGGNAFGNYGLVLSPP